MTARSIPVHEPLLIPKYELCKQIKKSIVREVKKTSKKQYKCKKLLQLKFKLKS